MSDLDEGTTGSRERRHRGLDPEMLYGIALLGGLALAWPAMSSAMHGETDILGAGIRLLVSVAALWAGLHLVNTLIGNYAHGIGAAPTARTPLHVAAQHAPSRRRDDIPALETPADLESELEAAADSAE